MSMREKIEQYLTEHNNAGLLFIGLQTTWGAMNQRFNQNNEGLPLSVLEPLQELTTVLQKELIEALGDENAGEVVQTLIDELGQ